ncbi:uncharacterized protein ASPWEDRAFT_44265 [Neofusicoccum parvum]|nr:uncharacterized protein ASPWEDRAFT_44265 [Neofusicoccum parvum]
MKVVLLTASLLVAHAIAAPTTSTPIKRDITNVPDALVDCDGEKFNDFQIQDAAQQGVDNTRGPGGPQPGGYPKEFENREGFSLPNCPSGEGTLAEFPILDNGKVYGGGRPGAYRVIYQERGSGNGRYCGLVYHPTEDDPGFEQCS